MSRRITAQQLRVGDVIRTPCGDIRVTRIQPAEDTAQDGSGDTLRIIFGDEARYVASLTNGQQLDLVASADWSAEREAFARHLDNLLTRLDPKESAS